MTRDRGRFTSYEGRGSAEEVVVGMFSWFGGASVDAARVREVVSAGAKVIDVRSPEEFASGHVPGAVNIPVQALGSRLAEVGAKEAPVVLYCRSGARSASAASALRANGWKEVIDVGPMSAFPR